MGGIEATRKRTIDMPTKKTLILWLGLMGLSLLPGFIVPFSLPEGFWLQLNLALSATASAYGLPWLALILGWRLPFSWKQKFGIVGLTLGLIGFGAFANEHGLKPLFGVPRPYVQHLVQQGWMNNAKDFYALGDKRARAHYLEPVLQQLHVPEPLKRHWLHETGYALPSGHAFAATSLFFGLGLWFLLLRRWRMLWTLGIWWCLVCYSRIVLGVHTAEDVWLGSLEGGIWGSLIFFLTRKIHLPSILEATPRGEKRTAFHPPN